jgi:hypothetical protein
VGIRAGIVNSAGNILARAVTVAIRYSLVRRQFGSQTKEKQILDYQTQQQRIFVPLSAAFAMICTGMFVCLFFFCFVFFPFVVFFCCLFFWIQKKNRF